MKKKCSPGKRNQKLILANSVSALTPQFWALESLYQLSRLCLAPYLVYRDYENMLSSKGQTVNAYLPAAFKYRRKGVNDSVTDQDATLTSVPVTMNQHLYVTFVIKDQEQSLAATDLIKVFLEPALRAQAEGLDQAIIGQVYRFMANQVGGTDTALGRTSPSTLQAQLTQRKLPTSGRNALLSPFSAADLLALDAFVGAEKVGDDGTALREGSLGRKYGISWLTSLAVPRLVTAGGATAQTNAINNASGYAAGATSFVFDGTGTLVAGCVVEINGYVYPVTGVSGQTATIAFGLIEDVADNDVIRSYVAGAFGAGYAVGYEKEVTITGIRGQVGEGIHTAAGDIYTIVEAGAAANSYILDRPLDAAVTNASKVGTFPDGIYNFAFDRNAIALVSRPLATPMEGTGALSSTATNESIGVRVVITYDGVAQGHRVTIDFLAGIKILNTGLGVPLLSKNP